MKNFLKEIFTDAAGRWEIKTILGIPTFLMAVVYAVATRTLQVPGFLMGTALVCLGITAAADHGLDRIGKAGS